MRTVQVIGMQYAGIEMWLCGLGHAARTSSDSMNLAGMRLPWAKPFIKSSKLTRISFPNLAGNWVPSVMSVTALVGVIMWAYMHTHTHACPHRYLFNCCLSCHGAVSFGKEVACSWACHFFCFPQSPNGRHTPTLAGKMGVPIQGTTNTSWNVEHTVHQACEWEWMGFKPISLSFSP